VKEKLTVIPEAGLCGNSVVGFALASQSRDRVSWARATWGERVTEYAVSVYAPFFAIRSRAIIGPFLILLPARLMDLSCRADCTTTQRQIIIPFIVRALF
jgi:hypothetical protein